MKIPPASLTAGDVLIVKYSDRWWHTMMVLDGARIAHAPGIGQRCTIDSVDGFIDSTVNPDPNAKRDKVDRQELLANRLFAYRAKGDMPWPGWDEFAEKWCDGRTPYAPGRPKSASADPWRGYPRNAGVENPQSPEQDGAVAAALMFGPDALFRTFKWALRFHENQPFSVNRGTTCCAFIMASLQASYINKSLYHDHLNRLRAVVGLFERGADQTPNSAKLKMPAVRAPSDHEKGVARTGGALREHSNRGLSDEIKAKFGSSLVKNKHGERNEAEAAIALWALLKGQGFVDDAWSDIGMPPSLCYDAKYMYSRIFNGLLAKDSANWTSL